MVRKKALTPALREPAVCSNNVGQRSLAADSPRTSSNAKTHLLLSPSPPSAHPIHAGMPEPLHPALCLRPGRYLLRHTCVPRGPLAPGCRVLLHPEVLPGGIQVMESLASVPGWGWGGGWEVLCHGQFGTLVRVLIVTLVESGSP